MKPIKQNSLYKIVIAGAGPAGTSAAIRLLQKGFRVVLIEREKFPRHKLCGEFISPECFTHFAELGVLQEMLAAGGERIAETLFYAPDGKNVSVKSEWFGAGENALGLSRAEMDFRLMSRAKAVGVEVLEETGVTGLLYEKGKVCGVKTQNGKEISADLTIDATGRSGVLVKFAERLIKKPAEKINKEKHGFVGFKTHLKNASLEHNRCEIYFFRGGYGGLNYVENGTANHCFLIKSEIVKEFAGNAEKIVREVVFQNRRAARSMRDAVAVYDWLAVAIDKFGTKNLTPVEGLVAVGDAGAFIDPFTGSGMLTAFESAALLAECSDSANFSPVEIARKYSQEHSNAFGKRFRVTDILRRAAFNPAAARVFISALSIGRKPLELLAKATRPVPSSLKK